MSTDIELPHSTEDLAALAFSLLPLGAAELVNRRLSIAERHRLREGLSRVHNATDEQRGAAVRALASAVRNGMEWPRPSAHDDADCPFNVVGQHPRFRVVDILQRVAAREPLEVVTTLCHLNPSIREELWERLPTGTKALILPRLNEVHLVSTTKTKEYARDINARLARA